MKRDLQQYPEDDNGNVLWQMCEDGAEMSQAYDIEFAIACNNQAQAEKCALYLLHQEQKVSLFEDDESGTLEWIVTIHVHMEPEYSDILDLEQWVTSIAEKFEVEYDGWSCLSYVYDDYDDEWEDQEEA